MTKNKFLLTTQYPHTCSVGIGYFRLDSDGAYFLDFVGEGSKLLGVLKMPKMVAATDDHIQLSGMEFVVCGENAESLYREQVWHLSYL